MKKNLILTVAILGLLSVPVQAHDFWSGIKTAAENEKLVVFLGYGHNFPSGEEIDENKYVTRNEPLTVIGSKGTVKLAQGTEPREFVSEQPLQKGSYLILSSSKNVFWSQTPDGWKMTPKNETPGAKLCTYGASYGKAIVDIGSGTNDAFIFKPAGQKLELVPQINPNTVRPEQVFPVKVFFEGKPLAKVKVNAFFAGFTEHNDAAAFSGTTDKDGLVNIIPLKSGQWLAKAETGSPYSALDECDEYLYEASLTFTISD